MPFINRNKVSGAGEFVKTVSSDRVGENAMTDVRIQGRKIILTRYNGMLYAIDAACPHAAADLSRGSLRGWQICCHEHDYCFDLRSGRIVWPEDEVYRLRRYETIEEDGVILVRLTPLR
jgi:nitrite reductase/ring-hydroxylating ferredoxin subunit